jgi:enamine deaminase RidA (YjgF/YER057c/UK114 family)
MKRINYSSGAVWENTVGYSRAVRKGAVIEISGTTSVEGSKIMHKGDPYLQTVAILKKISNVLEEAGASLSDVVRTRIYVTDILHWEAIAQAHSKYFKEIKPATTMIEVSRLIHPDLLVEIEFTAITDED